jgi:D-alanyl-D-alanine carboxypeptidase
VLRLAIEEATGVSLRDALRDRLFAPLGLEQTDLVEGPLRGECAHGYLAADNPILPGSGPLDVTEIDVPFHRAGGGIVSTVSDVATMLRAELSGELFSDRMRRQLLDAVESDWPESDRYGLGIGEMTALMGRKRSTCGAAWGHLGFSLGYVAFALSSRDGDRQVVICANGHPPEAAEGQFLDAAGELTWHLFCN